MTFYEKEISASDKIIWSVIFSVTTYAILFFDKKVVPFEEMITKIYDPIFLRNVIGTAMLIGFLIGLPFRIYYHGKILPKDCWIIFQKKLVNKGSWVVVYTIDGKEIEGYLNYVGREYADKELIISNPVEIKRINNDIYERNLGSEMLFKKDNIARIAFDEHF